MVTAGRSESEEGASEDLETGTVAKIFSWSAIEAGMARPGRAPMAWVRGSAVEISTEGSLITVALREESESLVVELGALGAESLASLVVVVGVLEEELRAVASSVTEEEEVGVSCFS